MVLFYLCAAIALVLIVYNAFVVLFNATCRKVLIQKEPELELLVGRMVSIRYSNIAMDHLDHQDFLGILEDRVKR